ncbi:adenosine deaminase [Tieghemostelium lacteum]|uniref:adenosine deaminase n=1 Tax=Tieghemostelium lacteum TaxID=361077 RepID=A0A151ZC55_TIELA|nr:adenosine deaminase [Tieghemostelium lacteum]|eukprot:KYQ91505.1 adenosine deaminase [Tieghemostelium lacteum]
MENKEITVDIIKKLPKCDLHRHLDGSIRISTILELAKEQNVTLPTDEYEKLSELILKDKNCTSLVNFLEAFHYTLRVLQKAYAITRVFYEICEDAYRDGLKYLEIRFSPILHIEEGLSLSEVMLAVTKGLALAELKLSIKARIIVCGMRHMPPQICKDLAEIAWRYKSSGVCGFDLAGPEKGFSSVLFKEAFQIIRNKGINCTIHSGEDSDYRSVSDSIHHCGAHRIGHGIAIQQSPELLNFMVDRRIPIECCITSNHQIKGIATLSDHPIRKYFDSGAMVVICCDNCTMSNVTSSHEFKVAIDTFKFTVEEVIRLVDYSFASTFLEAPLKNLLRRESVIEAIQIFKDSGYDLSGLLRNKDYYLEGPGIDIEEIVNGVKLPNLNLLVTNQNTLPKVTLEMLEKFPKSDVHCTFDGSVSVNQMWKEVQLLLEQNPKYFHRVGIEIGSDQSEFQSILQAGNNQGLAKNIMNLLLQSREQIQRGFLDIIQDAIKDNVKYIEITFRPFSHCKENLTYRQALEVFLESKKSIQNQYRDQIEISLILNSSSDYDSPIETFTLVNLLLEHKTDFVGFGIFGSEPIPQDHIKEYTEIFSLLKVNNIKLVQFAGRSDIGSIFSTIHIAGASRLSGCFQAHKLPKVLTYLSNYQIPIEISLTDRLKLSTADLSFTTPIRHLLDNNVPVVICSFKNSMYPLTRSQMLFEIVKNSQLDIRHVIRLLKNSFSYSFRDHHSRFKSTTKFNEYLHSLNLKHYLL